MDIYKLVFNPIEVNTYIVADDSGECAVIDCGCYDVKEFNKLSNMLAEKRMKPTLLLSTHCHLDHIFGDGFMVERYKTGSHCHIEELYNRKNAVNVASVFGLIMNSPPEPESFLTDGQVITFGHTGLVALHVPGHSAGSLAYYSEDEKVVFTGDALFSGSIGRTDLPGGNYETLLNSIKKKLFSLPPDTMVYPGHGEPTTIEKEIRTNPYFIHN